MKKTLTKELCLAVFAFLLVATSTGCSNSGSIDQLATENAKLRAENELLKSTNVALQAHMTLLQQFQNSVTCERNLRTLDGAAEEWAFINEKRHGDPVPLSALSDYANIGAIACPDGGSYSFRAFGDRPVCSVHSQR